MNLESRKTKFGDLSVGDIVIIKTKKDVKAMAKIYSLKQDEDPSIEQVTFHWMDEENQTWITSENVGQFLGRVRSCLVICNIATEIEWREIMNIYKKHRQIFEGFADIKHHNRSF